MCDIRQCAHIQSEKPGIFHHAVDRIAIVFIIAGKVEHRTFFWCRLSLYVMQLEENK